MLKNVKNLLIYNSISWLPLVVGFALLPIYTNHLSPEDYGVRALVLLPIIIFDVFSSLGLNWVIRSKYHKLGSSRGEYMFTILLYSIVFKLLILAVLSPFAEVFLQFILHQWDSSYIVLFNLQLVIFFMNGFVVIMTEIFVMERNAKKYARI